MNIDILSIWWFSFFLLIFLFWYIFVEIIFGENYFFANLFKRYDNNLFDRMIHYIFWGIILNIGMFYFNFFSDKWKTLVNLFYNSLNMGKSLSSLFWEGNSLHFLFFALFYSFQYFLLVAILIFVKYVLSQLFFKDKKPEKKVKKFVFHKETDSKK